MKDTLVLIPGFANTAAVWRHQVEHFKDLFDIAIFVMDRQASRKEMVQFLLEKAPPHFILVGHSMGGWVAQAAAATAPKRIDKLVLLNTWATADPKIIYLQQQLIAALKQNKFEEILKKHLGLIIHPSKQQDAGLLESLKAMIASFPQEVLIRQLNAMLEDYSSQHFHPAIEAPTLVVHSHDDALFPAKELQAIATGIKNSQLAIIDGAGHASMLEKPETVSALMSEFLIQ